MPPTLATLRRLARERIEAEQSPAARATPGKLDRARAIMAELSAELGLRWDRPAVDRWLRRMRK